MKRQKGEKGSMRRRSTVLFLTLIFIVATISACGGQGTENNNQENEPAASEDRSSAEEVTIRFHAQEVTFSDQMMEPVIAAFEEKNPGIKIEYHAMTEPSAEEVHKKIDLLAASGEPLDVFLLADQRTYAQRIANGMLEPLNDMIEAEGFNFDEEYKTDTSVDGTYYGLPGTFNQWFVIINKNHLEEAGLPVPTIEWTWDDYLDYAKKMTEGEGASKRYGTYFHTWPDYFLLGLWNQKENNDLVLPDYTVNVDHPGVKKSLEIRVQAEEDQSAVPYADSIAQNMDYRSLYFNEQISLMPIGSWMIGEVGGTDQYEANFETVFAPIPRNSESDTAGQAMTSSNYLVMASTSEHKEEAYQFMRFMSTEGLEMMNQYTTSWAKEDTSQIVDSIISKSGNPEMVDQESLLYVLDNTKPVTLPPSHPFQEEVYKLYQDEVELLLLGEQSLEDTLNNAEEKLQELVDANKE